MGLKTYSSFIYGHNITEDNQFIDFSEDTVSELGAQIDIGGYSITSFIEKVAAAMNEIGSQEYDVTLDRSTMKISISSVAPFDLYVTTGSRQSISAYELMGFTTDRSGSNSYEGDIASGFRYDPQFKLEKYVSSDDNVGTAHSSVNESASGQVEVVSYGEVKRMICEIILATDITPQGAIKENPNGVSDLRNFMNYLITKNPVEFIEDIDSPNGYEVMLLDSTKDSSKGTAFKLYEMYARKLFGYYETKPLVFRKIN